MILKKLYTSPKQLFAPIEFVPGINYIFGKKEAGPNGETGKSLNGIGKSLLLDFINFSLLSEFDRKSSPRLKAAYYKDILKGSSCVLEFEIDKDSFTISRSFDQPYKILFSKNQSPFSEHNVKEFKPFLCNLIFKRDSYEGIYNSKWLRRLLPFFIKVQSQTKTPFSSPINYIPEASEMEMNQYHFFLLNLNNTLLSFVFDKTVELKQLVTSIRKVNKLLSELYGSKLSKDLIEKKNRLKAEIDRLNGAINAFRLSDKYQIDQNAADVLTDKIKNLWFLNSSTAQKINSLEESLKVNTSIKVNSVTAIYQELNELLGNNIKKSLTDAIEFRKNLITSRKEFIESEVNRLKKNIGEHEKEISELENKRSQIFKILEDKKAFNDLRDAYVALTTKQDELNNLESRYKLLKDLNKKKNELKKALDQLSDGIHELIIALEEQITEIRNIILQTFDALYPEHSDSTIFDLIPNPKLQSKLNISILENAEMLSHGMNQGRTLIYDLAVLFYAIRHNIKSPRFLIHDGIMDGMDKTHFIQLVKYLEHQNKKGIKFQYIITLNEEGTLSDKFADGDLVNPANIEQEAILVLTPYKKLLDIDF